MTLRWRTPLKLTLIFLIMLVLVREVVWGGEAKLAEGTRRIAGTLREHAENQPSDQVVTEDIKKTNEEKAAEAMARGETPVTTSIRESTIIPPINPTPATSIAKQRPNIQASPSINSIGAYRSED